MKIATYLLTSLLLYQQSNGCDQTQTQPKVGPAKMERPPIHRFENVSLPSSPGVALDTVTGQLCRTWEWVYREKNAPGRGGLDTLPTCLSIYQGTPAQASFPWENYPKAQ